MRKVHGNFSHRGRCEKIQEKFKAGVSAYSLPRREEAIRDANSEIQPEPVRSGNVRETSPTAVGVRKFRESSMQSFQLTYCSVERASSGEQDARISQIRSDQDMSGKVLPPGPV